MCMQKEKVTKDAKWKVIYDQIWRSTPKDQRRTKLQVKRMRASAKQSFYLEQSREEFFN